MNKSTSKTFLQDEKFIVIVLDMINYTDAHCHIKPSFQNRNDFAGRIYNATKKSDWSTDILAQDDKTFISIGVHPWYITGIEQDWESTLYDILSANPHIMVGEIGMDKYHDDLGTQEKVFITQLEIAAQLRRPISLHAVGTWDKVLHILHKHEKNLPPVIIAHAFNGDANLINQIAERYNIYFSYSATDEKNIARISATPARRILSESDSYDELTAIEKVKTILNTISTVYGQTEDETAEQIYQNFQRVTSYVRPIE